MGSWLLLFCLLAGPSWAGQSGASEGRSDVIGAGQAGAVQAVPNRAWVAEYALRDGKGERKLVLVHDNDRVEYRVPGEPVRVWRRGSDGLQHQEIFPGDARVVAYSPGDLRALGRNPEWSQLAGLVDPMLRSRLKPAGNEKRAGGLAKLYQGNLDGERVELAWIEGPSLPAHYRRGTGRARIEVTLLKLVQLPAEQAFTATDDFREIDYADIGDMELDPFAQRYILQGAGASSSRSDAR